MVPLTEVSFPIASFDLHVLGTPPAFVLSQDQTLNNSYLKAASSAALKPLSLRNESSFISSKRISFLRLPSGRLLSKSPFLLVLKFCFSFLTMFNFQGTPSTAFQFFASAVKLYYVTTLSSVCQELFSNLFSSRSYLLHFAVLQQLLNATTLRSLCQELFSTSFSQFR